MSFIAAMDLEIIYAHFYVWKEKLIGYIFVFVILLLLVATKLTVL